MERKLEIENLEVDILECKAEIKNTEDLINACKNQREKLSMEEIQLWSNAETKLVILHSKLDALQEKLNYLI